MQQTSGSPFLSLASQRISFLTYGISYGSLVNNFIPSVFRNSYNVLPTLSSSYKIFVFIIICFFSLYLIVFAFSFSISFSIAILTGVSSCFSFAFLWIILHRDGVLTKRKEGKRQRIVLSNKRNLSLHLLEKILGKILNRLLIRECRGQGQPRKLSNAIGRLDSTLRLGLVFQSIIVGMECLALLLKLDRSVQPGPLRAGNLEIHGFTLGCSPGTTMRSLRRMGWPVTCILWEHDVKAAYESINLKEIFSAPTEKLIRHEMSVKLAAAIMDSDLIVREVYFPKSLWLSWEGKAAMIKQFPEVGSGMKRLSSCHLIQGSPLSPCLFNLFLLLHVDSSEKLVVYGDNFYSKSPESPKVSSCTFNKRIELGSRGRTLGLHYFVEDSRLVVTADDEGYARGVQRILDLPMEKYIGIPDVESQVVKKRVR